MRITKFIEYYTSFRKRFPTLKELEKRTIREKQLIKEVSEAELDDIDWNTKKDKIDKV